MSDKLEKHLFLADFHIPDQNKKIVELIYKLIKDCQADAVYLMGDVLNLTHASKYLPIGESPSTGEEIVEARIIINRISRTAQDSNPNVKIYWLEGNHSERLTKYIYRNAPALTDVTDEYGDLILTIPHIFKLKEHGITWVPQKHTLRLGDCVIEHGDIVRCKAGYSAQAMIDKRGKSTIMGHTHRNALVVRNQDGVIKFGWELGCLCNLQPDPAYVKSPDWVNSIGLGMYDRKERVMYPFPIMVLKNKFLFPKDFKLYST